MCLNQLCVYADVVEGQTCIVSNTVYTGYGDDGYVHNLTLFAFEFFLTAVASPNLPLAVERPIPTLSREIIALEVSIVILNPYSAPLHYRSKRNATRIVLARHQSARRRPVPALPYPVSLAIHLPGPSPSLS